MRSREPETKRGGDAHRVTLHGDLVDERETGVELLDLHDKLEVFRASQPRRAQVVELRFFGGLTFEEIAHVIRISPKTVEADWYVARAWLRRALRAGSDDGDR